MKLCDENAYIVYPTYGVEFKNMMPWLDAWAHSLPGQHHFMHGFSGGGILAVSRQIPMSERIRKTVMVYPTFVHCKNVYGMSNAPLYLGSEGARELSNSVACATGDRPPAFAVRMKLAERVPDPTVKVTAEHVDSLGQDRLLLVVPRATRKKSLKHVEKLPKWFQHFGIQVDDVPSEISGQLREEMVDWFSDPQRPMFAYRMSGGKADAAWQLAVLYYIAEYWDTQVRGLDTMHILAPIEGQPTMRKHWLSNK